jgi:7-cyano-7-deazaguanine synthase in queuosine biosynthesis
MSPKQRRQQEYAAQAGKKFKPKKNGGQPSADYPVTSSSQNARNQEFLCRCGQCLSCLERKNMLERQGVFHRSLIF